MIVCKLVTYLIRPINGKIWLKINWTCYLTKYIIILWMRISIYIYIYMCVCAYVLMYDEGVYNLGCYSSFILFKRLNWGVVHASYIYIYIYV